jgi:hypothetical protein
VTSAGSRGLATSALRHHRPRPRSPG